MPIRDAIILTFFLASLPICLFRPFYGVLLWTVVAFLNPQRFAWGAAESFPLAQAVAIPTLVGSVLFSRNWSRVVSRESLLTIALWMWFTITTVVSVNTPLFEHHSGDTWFQWQFVSKILLMTVITMALVNNRERLRLFVLVMSGCFGFLVLKTLPFMILTGGEFRVYGPEYSMLADNNDFGLALNMSLPFFFYLSQTESNRWVKMLFGGLFVITIPAIFFTYSRGALVGLVAILGVMFLQSKRRLLLIPVIALGLVIALLLAPQNWRARMDPSQPDALDASARSRLNSWTYSYRLALETPITGGGFATFTPKLYERYATNVLDVHGPHSIYFGVLAEHGFVGLFLYLALIFSCFASTRRLVRQARLFDDQQAISYARMFQYSLVGFLTSGAFLGRAYFDYYFSIVACIAVSARAFQSEWILSSQSSADSEEEISEVAVLGART